MKSLGEQYEHGVVVLDEATTTFKKAKRFRDDAMLHPRGQALAYENGLKDYVYFCRPFPSVRVRLDAASIESSEAYETYTCLKTSSRFDAKNPSVEYDTEGRAVWGWKRDTDFIDARRMHQLIQGGHIQPDEAVLALRDEDKLIYVDSGSVHWNEYRKKWIMIAGQLGGGAFLYW